MNRILLVDDEANLRRLVRLLLEEEGHSVAEAASLAEARGSLGRDIPDLVITDQKLGDGEGLDVLDGVRAVDETVPVLLLSAFASVELAVQAMRQGAFDVIPKPFDPEGLKAAVRRALAHGSLLRENSHLKDEAGRAERGRELLGRSQAMMQLLDAIERVAPTHATVLISGETGTGKELVARAIHARSARSGGPFVALNCAAMPENLLESELFGHEKGAYTGADRARPGLFETAHGGTLFLDEAGEMPPSLQAKLLRVLVDGQVLRVGSRSTRKVDARVLAATHRNLEERVREGLFREDLYYRLAVFPLRVPPLRERMEDLPLLVSHFLKKAAQEMGLPLCSLSEGALARLSAYAFPGNIRELRNLLERACILAIGEEIGPDDFPLGGSWSPKARGIEAYVESLPPTVELPAVVADLEWALLERALAQSGGVQAEAARRLGISRSDLHYKIKRRVRES
ncbi:MAG: sigma-54-dependent Fis family transcriptional regulator [Acidobacteriota bacterium]|nr:sigma-54-dependent Fis family transcriptional regulator [Acidobacteriota bacterium]